ncbi:unnamed protein product [Callosobruchus maculatus]|uniref:Integrase catalytic domain-containing protein n=1 Tax=Callosobruchus maculatus TaxID=64391 RepID=A0A653CAK1_CALMS|nr:unnamed protein product [Callosobruchus maculatus]
MENPSTLHTLTRKRGSVKARITTFQKFLSEVLDTDENEIDLAKMSVLARKLEKVIEAEAEFVIVQSEIECLVEDDDLENQYAERETIQGKLDSLIANAKDILATYQANSVHSREDISIKSDHSEYRGIENEGIKLPTIKLPKFDGKFDKWLEFRDTFGSMIHEGQKLSQIQKFHYLRAALEGKAARVISHIGFSSENYELAWSILRERYDNVRQLKRNHVKALFDLEALESESSERLCELNDNMSKHLSSLKRLGEAVESWDTLVIHIMSNKLDKASAREWEKIQVKKDVSLETFKQFLKDRAELLQSFEEKKSEYAPSRGKERSKKYSSNVKGLHSVNSNTETETIKYACVNCKKDHNIYYCPDLLQLSVQDRIQRVKQLKLCSNCLRPYHEAKDCRSGGCRICKGRHNTALHVTKETRVLSTEITNENQSPHGETRSQTRDSGENSKNSDFQEIACTLSTSNSAMLSTALVHVYDKDGVRHTVRALLDCGSQTSFISAELRDLLKIPKIPVQISVSGIADSPACIDSKCKLKLFSTTKSFSIELQCLVIKQITGSLPNVYVNKRDFEIPAHVNLADPTFNIPNKIDILLGADVFWNLLCVGQIHVRNNMAVLQKTQLGWILGGPMSREITKVSCHLLNISSESDTHFQLEKFWKVEEVEQRKLLSAEEEMCERHFRENTCITKEGRYMVALPLKGDPSTLGDSRSLATKRFFQLEKRLLKNENLKTLYVDFLDEYERLGHMCRVDNPEEENGYYMPHHGVLRENSISTKLRVVFNASSPGTTGISLNDIQMVGPTVQDELISIILRFRLHKIILSADIRMMYRQILVQPEHRKLQRILWRPSPDKPLETYELQTVTYGTAAASFLATRCLYELAEEVSSVEPSVAQILKHDMYVDDVLTGCNSAETAKDMSAKLIKICQNRGFELLKWRSNSHEVLSHIKQNHSSHAVLEFSSDKESSCKTLGLCWSSSNDDLTYKTTTDNLTDHVTKRSILSRISSIFDPLGLLSPSIILVKILLQEIWSQNCKWDESLPQNIHLLWIQFASEISCFDQMLVPRKILCDNPDQIELHCFCDASERAYGSCIYVKSWNAEGECDVHLFCAKSKVAPLKTLTIPRLELCAALVLSRLLKKLLDSVPISFSKIYCWSDSTIVLNWLRTPPNLLKQFVNNRVAEIQETTCNFEWKHISSSDNPADMLSRGLSPKNLIQNESWWHGPQWLQKNPEEWPQLPFEKTEVPEIKKSLLTQNVTNFAIPYTRFSILNRLVRSFAYVLRFLSNSRLPEDKRHLSYLTVPELQMSLHTLLKYAQLESFSEDYSKLQKGKQLQNGSKLLSLNPFIDKNGLLRVGGRLENSEFSFDKKHPIIVDSHHHMTKLIFESEHKLLLHAGPQLLLNHIREKYWPIRGRNLARSVVRNCVRCSRFAQETMQPLMGNLPEARVKPALPFTSVGVDYAGYFNLKDKRGRGSRISKCWLCLFICFTTRAIHIEVVTSLTTEDFMKAFKRLISRRGKPSNVYSDNGLNFVGAANEMSKFLQSHSVPIADSSAQLGMRWHFIPANSPNFGGLWEAGVKSIKHHLKRVAGDTAYTYEDFSTLCIQIEGILNSRPISPMSSDPDDLLPLTPSHFLIGRSLEDIPEPDFTSLPTNRLSNYQHLCQLQQHFWERWSKEYVSQLQQRYKWKRNCADLQVGQLVLIKESGQPPLRWKLGRVLNLIPGNDGICRVATLKTSTGIVRRALNRLCILAHDQQ